VRVAVAARPRPSPGSRSSSRNRSTFLTGRHEIEAFLTEKWEREIDYALRKELWAFHRNRIAVRLSGSSFGQA
jgi:nuclear transport factor 2 (NTF2) superfamily protein